MYEVVRIGSKDVPMSATAATPIYYKTVFQEDLLSKFADDKADGEWFGRLAYIMAMQGANRIKEASMDNFIEWLDTFDPLDIFGVEENNKVIELFAKQQKETATAKKKDAGQSGK